MDQAPATRHIPVLRDQVVAALVQRLGGRYIDCTVGAGGHAEAILTAAGLTAELLGIDTDPLALAAARERLTQFCSQVILLQGNFRRLAEIAKRHGFEQVNGIVLDLGMSSMQLADETRGFSFKSRGVLDMRFDPSQGITAAEFLNSGTEREIAGVLRAFGEEPLARRIAKQIVSLRPIRTSDDLAHAVRLAVPPARVADALARVFQAVRIAVNDELEALQEALKQAVSLLVPGGRLAVISFHSLEDRIVKRFLKRESATCLCPPELPRCVCGHQPRMRLVTRAPIVPGLAEVERNPRSRSAKLRVAEKT
ncbi:MAG: 16S rRNA (cytosine(1402)-N(4))-methyltransferase RsmH [Anaerolineae bacterium]